MIRTSVLIVSCCLALLRQPVCGGDDGPCEYEDTPLDADYITQSGMTLGEEVEALEGSYSGTWRWHASWPQLTIEDGGLVLPAQATFVPSGYRLRERASAGVACLDTGLKVDGVLTFTDDQGDVIASMDFREEGELQAVFTFGGQSAIGTTSIGSELGAGVILEVAAFE